MSISVAITTKSGIKVLLNEKDEHLRLINLPVKLQIHTNSLTLFAPFSDEPDGAEGFTSELIGALKQIPQVYYISCLQAVPNELFIGVASQNTGMRLST